MADEIRVVAEAIPFSTNGSSNIDAQPFQSIMESAIMTWLVPSQHSVAPHWSRTRDQQLRKLWMEIDPLKIAVNTFVNKAVTIPVRIHPRDRAVKRHVKQAADFESRLYRFSGLMRGWKLEFKKYILDYLSQDNGAFMLVIGRGASNLPIVGSSLGILHLDSQRCQRTGDPTYPVIYTHVDSKRYRMHYTRVIYTSNLPSPNLDLFGVGHCAVTCALDSAIEMRDIYTYMQEKLGSRPKRQIIYAKTGTTRDKLLEAFEFADDKMDSEGLKRFSKTVMLAPKNPNGQLELGLIDMAATPDNFNRKDVSLIDISHIASAFGLDLQDLSINYGVSVGSQKAGEIQERKGRGKGVGELLEDTQTQLDEKFLPPQLYSLFDNQDDQQDEQQAKIWDLRSTARQRDLTTGSTTVQVERARMLRNAEITEEEYAQMELLDGRLPNGASVIALFFSRDPLYIAFLDFDSENITNPKENDIESVLGQIDEQEKLAYIALEVAPTRNVNRKLFEILAALSYLRALYEGDRDLEEALSIEEDMRSQELGMNAALGAQEDGLAEEQPAD